MIGIPVLQSSVGDGNTILTNYMGYPTKTLMFSLLDTGCPIVTAVMNDGGTNYVKGNTLALVQSGASGGTVTVDDVDITGTILSVTLVTPGKNYSTALALTVTGGAGTDATIDITATQETLYQGTEESNVSIYVNNEQLAQANFTGIVRWTKFTDILLSTTEPVIPVTISGSYNHIKTVVNSIPSDGKVTCNFSERE